MTQTQVSKMAQYSVSLMCLTSIHHIYGAIIYGTPWRLHILMLSIPVIVLTLLFRWLLLKKENKYSWALKGFCMFITLVASVGMIGVYEGLYNHALKNILFFGGASHEILQAMFPAPIYEMPNDLIFEFTGVMQGLIVVPMIVLLTKLSAFVFKKRQAV